MTYVQNNNLYLNKFNSSLDDCMVDFLNLHRENAVNIWINTDGGDSYRAFALVQAMQILKDKGVIVRTNVLHSAHSAGSLVAVAGTKGVRKVSKGGSYLLHYGSADGTSESPKGLQRVFEENQRHFKLIKDHLLRYTDIFEKNMDDILLDDNYYMTAKMALEVGAADGYL